jgi:hypothetical protein
MSHSWQSFPPPGGFVLTAYSEVTSPVSAQTRKQPTYSGESTTWSVMHIVMNPGTWRLRTEKKGKSD